MRLQGLRSHQQALKKTGTDCKDQDCVVVAALASAGTCVADCTVVVACAAPVVARAGAGAAGAGAGAGAGVAVVAVVVAAAAAAVVVVVVCLGSAYSCQAKWPASATCAMACPPAHITLFN